MRGACIIGLDTARQIQMIERKEALDRAIDGQIQEWRWNGEICEQFQEILTCLPNAEILIDNLIFGDALTRSNAAAVLYDALRARARERLQKRAGL